MLKAVIYGSTPDDPELLTSLRDKISIDFEPERLNDTNVRSDADIFVLFHDSVLESHQVNPRLKAVVNRAAGEDNIRCMDMLEEKRVRFFRNSKYATPSVAEYSLFAITRFLSEAYFLGRGERAELAAQKVAVIGYGAIGRRLTKYLTGVGATVYVVTDQKSEGLSLPEGSELRTLSSALNEADIVCLHSALHKSNTKFVNADFFAAMKRGSLFVNAARGELVDNSALLIALHEGVVKSAYLDVLTPDTEKDIRDHPNVIFTNHTAWKTPQALKRSQKYLVDTLQKLANELS